jgi:hypothetical protein
MVLGIGDGMSIMFMGLVMCSVSSSTFVKCPLGR